ncbi:mechanosensitive ion channel family protein [Georgenia sp. EYE_87]|uniref:mechanosensitive ion channel family protein n=1 Tax=Georgenia sp. EYE_87 TaxID=2853448 RepID=UPI002002D650|nr:mechanosensitive ion channel family protein [Georgenia sp. EYE_87]
MRPPAAVDSWELPPVEPGQLGAGALVIVGGWVLSRLVRAVLRRYWTWRRRSPSFSSVFASMTGWVVLALAVGAGLTIAFPSVRPINILGGLGVASIAAGIAFQAVLGNLFAGVLLISREPFRSGDQIALGDVRGTVDEINLRETVVRTFDGRRVLIPNSVMSSGVVTVQTGYEKVRTSVVVGVAYDADLERARSTALTAVEGLPSVARDPAPQALITELGSSTINIELRFWSGARQLETLEAQDQVIGAVVRAFNEAEIAMPADIRVLEASPSFTAALAGLGRGDDGGRRERSAPS